MGFKTKFKKSPPKVLNAWLLFLTILVITLILVYYTSIFVKKNEKEQIAKRFRVLAQMGENTAGRERGFRTIAGNVVKGAWEKYLSNGGSLMEFVNPEIQQTNKLLKVAGKNESQGDSILILRELDIDESPYIIFLRLEDFFQPLHREDVFSGLIVLAPSHTKNGTEANKDQCRVLYHTFQGDIDFPGLEKLTPTGSAVEVGALQEMTIANKKYSLFLQPVRLTTGEKWYLAGVMEKEVLDAECRRLKPGIITPLFILFAIFLFSIPLLKLFLMSNFERLDLSDVILTGLSISLGVIAITLFALYIFQAGVDYSKIEENLDTLAEQVKKNVSQELTDACYQLKVYDSSPILKGYNLEYWKNFNNVLINPPASASPDNLPDGAPGQPGEKTSGTFILRHLLTDLTRMVALPVRFFCKAFGNTSMDEFFSLILSLFETSELRIFNTAYDLFKVLFWIDGNGQQVLQFTTRDYGGRLINVSSRKYFQDAGHWQMPGKPEIRFMLQSITSMTSGEKLAAISMESNSEFTDSEGDIIKPKVIAITTQPCSLIDVITPEGYGFCIMDKTGYVWFHSDSRRNLQENFIREAENNKALLSAVNSNQAKHLGLDYQNTSHKCFIMPFPDIPLYIVTFYDRSNTFACHGTTLVHAIFFILVLGIFNGLLFVAVAWSNYRKSLLKRKYVSFEWLRPVRKNTELYRRLIFTNVLIIALLIGFGFFLCHSGVEIFFLCAAAALFSFVYHYYVVTGKEKNHYPLHRIRLLVFFAAGLLVINIPAVWLLEKFLLLPLFQVVLFVVLVVFHRRSNMTFPFLKGDWGRSYIYLLWTWLVLVGVIPVLFFFLHAYNYESEVALRRVQAKLAEQIEERDWQIDKFYNENLSQPDHPSVIKMKFKRKTSGLYTNFFLNTDVRRDGDFPGTALLRQRPFDPIAYGLKLPFNRLAAETRDFVFPAAFDKSRTWAKKHNRLYLKYQLKNSHSFTPGQKDNDIVISTTLPSFKFPGGLSLISFIIVIGFILGLAYYMIRFSTRMIFGLNLLEYHKKKRTYSDAQEEIRETLQAGSDVIVYCPTQREKEYCRELFREGSAARFKFEVSFFDLLPGAQSPGDILEKKPQVVFIDNFELAADDSAGNLDKLGKIKPLLSSPHIRVIIPASVSLAEILEYYEEKLERISLGKESPAPGAEVIADKKLSELLCETRNALVPVVFPIKPGEQLHISPDATEESRFGDLINRELGAAAELKGIRPVIQRYYKRLKENQECCADEKVILKIQDLARPFYHVLLNTCSRKERYILHDLAQDMLVNANNIDALDQLLKKGLVIYDGTFRLMNESFRNFVLSMVDREGLEFYVSRISPKWKSYKTPLFLIALGAAVFFAFQEDLLGKADALVTTVIGGVAIITKFSGIFSTFSAKTPSAKSS